MLGGTFALRDVRDVEGLCRTVINTRLREWNAHLNRQDEEDLLTYLITLCWELDGQYDASFGISFSTFAYRRLRLRIVDWFRSRFGDSRHGKKPELLALEDTAFDSVADEDDWVADADDRISAVQDEWNGVELTDRGRWILDHIARPLSDGQSHEEIAVHHNRKPRWVREQLAVLRSELE